MLPPTSPTLTLHPDLLRVFVFDMSDDAQGSFALKRLQFVADSLAEIPGVLVYNGETAAVLIALDVKSVVTQSTRNDGCAAVSACLRLNGALSPLSPNIGAHCDDLPRTGKRWNGAAGG